ncbi:uncharacterized protein LOC129728619 [Wyeomyia smithii]|uniref:uncharacterized protein LOC129728619 n=1 Tax=Wyeomyia smithii TaxID=174621 RepID=UPI00246813FE|nr:uncharacterized protein LOC129728619 [Wyeomyia smithii]
MARNCSSESTCRNCRGHNHTLICTSTSQQSFQGNVSHTTGSLSRPRNPSSQRNEEHVSSASAVQPGTTNSSIQEASRNKILLATAVILLVDGSGGEYPVRALLDSGSECSFITERVTQRMGIRRVRVSIAIAGIGQSSTRVLPKIRSTIKSLITDFVTAIELLIFPKVTVDLPSMSVDVTSWSLPTGIQLQVENSLGDTLPTLVNSAFGWIVSGKVSEGAPRSAFVCNVASTADLHNDMKRFWAIEDEPTTAYSPEEALCEKIFSEIVTRDSDGRYVVRLPLKSDLLDNLGDNRRSALHSYRLIENLLGRDPGLATEYRKFMDEYFQLGHMERIDENNASSQAFFLPHHPVIRAESSTTKVRVVFDASCKSATGRSLNDVMLVGPTVQQDLRSIIIRSRLHPIMLIADITKMYRQIRLHPGDTHLQRIFWRSTPDEPIGVYELKTVTYATRVISQLATDEKCHYLLAAEVACKDFYVDDLFTGTKTVNEAIELRKQMEAMFNSAGMKLRKWASNVPASLQDVPEENRAIKDLVDFDKDHTELASGKTVNMDYVCSKQSGYNPALNSKFYHERLLHAAVQLLTNTIRLRFWILVGRSLARQIVQTCIVCFRAKPKLVEQFMAELPSARVTASRPFSIVGIDFWGPIYLKPRHRRDSPPKAYVAVFICFATKAVH